MLYVLLCSEMYIFSGVAFFSGVETRSDYHVRDVQATVMGANVCKGQSEKGILVVMVGGPAYRIDLTALIFLHRSYSVGLPASVFPYRSCRIGVTASVLPHRSCRTSLPVSVLPH